MHVTRLGLTSAKDWTITRRAVDDGFILMTNNTADFTALYGREELHVGLVCLNAAPGTMSLDLQKRLFLLALAELEDIEPYTDVTEITAVAKGEITAEQLKGIGVCGIRSVLRPRDTFQRLAEGALASQCDSPYLEVTTRLVALNACTPRESIAEVDGPTTDRECHRWNELGTPISDKV